MKDVHSFKGALQCRSQAKEKATLPSFFAAFLSLSIGHKRLSFHICVLEDI